MNLEMALLELTKRPQSMIAKDGKSYPALRYSEHMHAAITWLVKRYNDGTLQVVGYDQEKEVIRQKLTRHSIRRGHELDTKGYMQMSKFIRETGFAVTAADRLARESKSRIKVGRNVYVNVNKFFHYLDHLSHMDNDRRYVNLTEAAQIMGLEKAEVKELIKQKKLRINENSIKSRVYQIYVSSINSYLRRTKGDSDEQNSGDDGQVYGEGEQPS